MPLRVTVAGPVGIEVDGSAVDMTRLGRSGRLVLAYLVCERHRAVPRDEVAEGGGGRGGGRGRDRGSACGDHPREGGRGVPGGCVRTGGGGQRVPPRSVGDLGGAAPSRDT